MVALALRRLEYDNIYAYSYGSEGNVDSITSRKIATDLGIEWHFVEYTPKKWQDWYQSSERKEMDESLWIHSTLPLGDWPAVRELRQDGTMADDAIVTTGQTGGILSGDNIPSKFLKDSHFSEKMFQNWILETHYDRNEFDQSKVTNIRNRISATAENSGRPCREAVAYVHKWNLLERQTKHITTATQTFESEDVDWWLPLCDVEYVEFWTDTELDQRINQKVYFNYVDQLYQTMAEAEPPKQAKRTSSLSGRYLNYIKKFIKNSPIGSEARQIYKKEIRSLRSSYDGMNADPRVTLTVMDYDKFKTLHNGDIGLASYRARELLGDVKLQEDNWIPPIKMHNVQ